MYLHFNSNWVHKSSEVLVVFRHASPSPPDSPKILPLLGVTQHSQHYAAVHTIQILDCLGTSSGFLSLQIPQMPKQQQHTGPVV